MERLVRELSKLIEVRATPIPCEEQGRVAVRLTCNVQPALDMIEAIKETIHEQA